MAAKGSILKKEIAQKILEVFPNSFLYNDGKEIRINGVEEGVDMQIKIVMTAAKTSVENVDSVTIASKETKPSINTTDIDKIPQEPTEEEKERLVTLLNKLGL